MDGLSRLNEMAAPEAREALLRCCASLRWAEGMERRRPFRDAAELLAAAQSIWSGLAPSDWLEAFGRHPGRDEPSLTGESRAYETRFGYAFICAGDKSAEDLAALLEARLANDPELELHVAAAEQARITRRRLEELLRS